MENKVRIQWDLLGAKRLRINKRPSCDLKGNCEMITPRSQPVEIYLKSIDRHVFEKWNGGSPHTSLVDRPLVSYYNLYVNTVTRMWVLATILTDLYTIYKSTRGLYGENYLAWVGNSVVRAHSWIEFPFTSVAAQQSYGNHILTGLRNEEIKPTAIRNLTKSSHLEHFSPISLFRDGFHQQETMTVSDFFELLVCNFRVVRITQKERDRLRDHGFEQYRPLNAYEICEIEIFEKELWKECMNCLHELEDQS